MKVDIIISLMSGRLSKMDEKYESYEFLKLAMFKNFGK